MSARKFLVTVAIGKQGGALIEVLLANKSSNFDIYGLTRNASSNSAKNLTAKKITMIEGETTKPGPIFEKVASEREGRLKPTNMAWTILRPVGFYDNLTSDFMGKSFAQIMKQMEPTKLNMIGSKDIGKVAAQAFQDPDKYKYKAFTLAGDSLNFEKIEKTFKEEVGSDLSLAPAFLASFFKFIVPDIGKIFEWFAAGNYSFNISQVKAEHPDLQD